MNCKFINVLMFAAGAAIGSAVTWKVVKTKYERIAQEEIESVKEAFGDINTEPDEINHSVDDIRRASAAKEQAEQINWEELEDLDEDDEFDEDDREEYANLTTQYKTKEGGAEAVAIEPYVISPFDFGELDDYHQFELTYYADETIEDTEYNIVTDVEELIGPKALHTFGEYEEDAVFVRNERLRADFQILKDYRTYEEARSTSPKRVDHE